MHQFGVQSLPFEGVRHAIGKKAGIALAVQLLQAAAATGLKMLARGVDMMRALDQTAFAIQPVTWR